MNNGGCEIIDLFDTLREDFKQLGGKNLEFSKLIDQTLAVAREL